MTAEALSKPQEKLKRDAAEEGKDTSAQDGGWSGNSGCEGGDRLHSEGQPSIGAEAERIIDELARVVSNGNSKIKLVSCRIDPKVAPRETRVEFRIPAYPFFPPGSKVLIYVNQELPFFVGFSTYLFPELGRLLQNMKVSDARKMLRQSIKSWERIAVLVWLLDLLRYDEKFDALVRALSDLSEQVRRCRVEKTKIQAVKKLVEALE